MAKKKDPVLWISASQIDTHESCPRKRWFEKKLKLPVESKDYFTFGTVLHACAERFFSADEQGRVPGEQPVQNDPNYTHVAVVGSGPLKGQKPGDPVDLYPKDWTKAFEKDGSVSGEVTPNEAKLIKKLISQAIEKGVLVWEPDGQVERKFVLDVIEDVKITGYIDFYRPERECINTDEGGSDFEIPEIHDHKTFSESSQRFLQQPKESSPNYIGENQQLLTYGSVIQVEDGWDGDIIIRHNQFPKFNLARGARSVQTVVSAERLRRHWKWVKEVAREIQKCHKIEKWDDVPGPKEDGACQKYGGCPFQSICNRSLTVEAYTEQTVRKNKNKAKGRRINVSLDSKRSRKKKKTGGTSMGKDIFAKARAKKAATKDLKQKAAEPETPAPAVTETKQAAPTVAAHNPAPWAKEGCKPCGGTGFNLKTGAVCQICRSTAKKRGVAHPDFYDVSTDGEFPVAVAKEEHEEALTELGAPLEWVGEGTAAPEPAAEAPAEEPKPAQEAAQEPAADALAEESDDEAPAEEKSASESEDAPAAKPKAKKKAAKKAGRPTTGLTLLLNGASMVKGPRRDTITAQEALEQVGAALAEQNGADSYWELDAFKRRERIRQRGEPIAAEFDKMVVLFPQGSDPDIANLMGALMPHAKLVIEG